LALIRGKKTGVIIIMQSNVEMKHRWLMLILTVCEMPLLAAPQPGSGYSWKIIFEDNFDGTGLNTSGSASFPGRGIIKGMRICATKTLPSAMAF
jgi:hypothetical protein